MVHLSEVGTDIGTARCARLRNGAEQHAVLVFGPWICTLISLVEQHAVLVSCLAEQHAVLVSGHGGYAHSYH